MKPNPFRITGTGIIFHHAYLGALLMGWAFPINFFGVLILIDDVYEHVVDYYSPLRRFFDIFIVPQVKL